MASPPLSPRSPASATVQSHACTTCVQRKVKCDRRQPCLACTKSRLHCSYRATPPPQRRRRKTVEVARAASTQALLDRVRSYEAILRSSGLAFESLDDAARGPSTENDEMDADVEVAAVGGVRSLNAHVLPDHGAAQDVRESSFASHANESVTNGGLAVPAASAQGPLFPRRRGVLIPEYGGKRYYEHDLIGTLAQKYRQGPQRQNSSEDVVESPANEQRRHSQQPAFQSTSASIFMGLPMPQSEVKHPQPPPSVALRYWTVFLDNVHPLTKILHAPTVRELFVADGGSTALGPNTEALKFSIYASAVASLSERECRERFCEEKAVLLFNMQEATRFELFETSFQRVPHIDLLRAYILLLTSMLHTTDSSSLWVMVGSAMRMAQSQGLHRDGTLLGLSSFETEMRRRLWWYLITLDGRLTEIMGSEISLPRTNDTCMPSNLDDADLRPDMSILPSERSGASEMVFCLLKYETTRFLQNRDPRVDTGSDSEGSLAEGRRAKRRTVDDLEALIQDRFLRFCDPVVPLHLLTTTIARSSICKLRHMEQRGRSHPSRISSFDAASEKRSNRTILHMATRNVSYDNLIHSSRSLAGFLWHVDFYFPWGAPIFILKILASARVATEWDEAMHAAWAQMLELHDHHPEFRELEPERVEHLIVADLTLKAWHVRQVVLASSRDDAAGTSQVPPVIEALQARKEAMRAAGMNVNRSGVRWANNGDEERGEVVEMTDIDSVFSSTAFEGLDLSLVDINWFDWGNY